jgi:hypothetical protein
VSKKSIFVDMFSKHGHGLDMKKRMPECVKIFVNQTEDRFDCRGMIIHKPGRISVTICAKDRECLFGKITNRKMMLNEPGQMVETVWNELPKFYPRVSTDAFQIMPNHIHGIVVITHSGAVPTVGAGPRACPVVAQPGKDGRRCENGQPQGVAPTG